MKYIGWLKAAYGCLSGASIILLVQLPAMAGTVDGNGNTLQGFIAAPLVQTSLDGVGNRLEGIVPGPFPLANSVDGNGVGLSTAALLDEGSPTGEGEEEGEGTSEGQPEGGLEGEGEIEGVPEGAVEGLLEGEGATEGQLEGASEGEGSTEGTVEGSTEGAVEGEGELPNPFEQLLFTFASADVNANSLLPLDEIQAQVPFFTQLDLELADANGDEQLSVAELLSVSPRAVINSSDTSGDYVITLSELLRVVQLYNAGGYACASNPGATEDGYIPQADPGPTLCLLHTLDSNENNQISLSELLRAIQIFSFKGYVFCESQSEDNFCDRP